MLVESYLENCTKDKRKPAHDGICILELSTVLIHDFHYGYELKKYGGKAKLLFTDRNSLAYEFNMYWVKQHEFHK